MTSRLLMPVRTAGTGRGPGLTPESTGSTGSTRPTPILDLEHPRVVAFVARVLREADERGAVTARDRLRTAHGIIVPTVRRCTPWRTGAACPGRCGSAAARAAFDSRDELFTRHGQTLCRPARTLAEPVLGRWSAGAVD